VFPVPWFSKWSWSLHLFLGRPMFLRPFGLYCSACFGVLFVSILCTGRPDHDQRHFYHHVAGVEMCMSCLSYLHNSDIIYFLCANRVVVTSWHFTVCPHAYLKLQHKDDANKDTT
jgi:Flp pilus assembly protein protease CpaA